MTQLDLLSVGEIAHIVQVDGEGAFRRRLLELGLVPGTVVKRIGQAPLGDPISYHVRGSTLSLRRRDAQRLWVKRD